MSPARPPFQPKSSAGAPDRPDRSAHRPIRKRKVAFWLGIAAVVHGELALILGMAFYFFAPRDADLQRELAARGPGESIDVGMVDEDAARQIIADLEREEEKHKAEQVAKEVDSIKAPGQVIDLPTPREERRPDEARFAGEHDSTVQHETHKLGKFEEKSRQGARDVTSEVERPSAEARPDGRLAMREPDLGRALKINGPAGPLEKARPTGSTYGVTDPGEIQPDGSLGQLGMNAPARPTGGGLPAGGAPALIPTSEQLAHVIGGGTQDALQDVDDGEETALNSKKWRFATFSSTASRSRSPSTGTPPPRRPTAVAIPTGRHLRPPEPLHRASASSSRPTATLGQTSAWAVPLGSSSSTTRPSRRSRRRSRSPTRRASSSSATASSRSTSASCTT